MLTTWKIPVFRGLRLGPVVLLGLLLTSVAWGRPWSDKSGKHQIEANLVTVKDGKAYLEKADGKIITIALEQLSPVDVEYLRSLPEYAEQFGGKAAPEAEAPAAAPSGSRMAVIHVPEESYVGEVRLFDDLGATPRSMCFSPNGGLLAVGTDHNTLVIYDVDASKVAGLYSRLDALGNVTALAFSPDGRKLVCGGERGRVQVWNVAANGTLSEGIRYFGHTEAVFSIAVSRDGRTVFSGGRDRILRCWDLETGRERFYIDGFVQPIANTYITPAAKQGLACDGAALILVDVRGGKVTQAMALTNRPEEPGFMTLARNEASGCVSLSPETVRGAICSNSMVRIWDIRTGREAPPLNDKTHPDRIAFLPNGRFLLASASNKVSLWEVSNQEKIYEFDTRGGTQLLATSPDNRHFAGAGGELHTVQVFRMPADVAIAPTRKK